MSAGLLNIAVRRRWLRCYCLGSAKSEGAVLFLAKPLTFMNRSGKAVVRLLRHTGLRPSQMVVVYDNLDLAPGQIRLKRRGSSGGHRGVQSVIDHVGTNDFPRLSIGIGRPEVRDAVIDYVLELPEPCEAALLDSAFGEAARAVLDLVRIPIDVVMNRVNQRF